MTSHRFESACGPLDAVVHVPGSKSITNRALILAALADGVSVLRNVLLAEDTWLMIEALRGLGIPVTIDEAGCAAEVTGCGGHIPAADAELFCGNSGTTIRFCTALAALSRGGRFRLDGIARMRRRPIGGLADVLQSLGAGIEYDDEIGFPPLTVHARGLRGGHVAFASPASSQFVSAMLMVAPCASSDILLEVGAEAPSLPFMNMTVRLMEQFGVPILSEGIEGTASKRPSRFIVEAPQRYSGTAYAIEPDATNAMYFLAAPAVTGGQVTVPGIGTKSIQGDLGFVEILSQMGCEVVVDAGQVTVSRQAGSPLHSVDVDLGAMPDVAPTLAALALFADGVTTIRNVAGLRIKETDRLAALATELTKLGATVEEFSDSLRITPPQEPIPAEIDTYDDHRMAMSFSLAGVRCPGLIIKDIECSAKTFPDFFVRFDEMLHTA